jgi:hypothetical protein
VKDGAKYLDNYEKAKKQLAEHHSPKAKAEFSKAEDELTEYITQKVLIKLKNSGILAKR